MNRKLSDLFSILVITMLLLQISFNQVEMVDADTQSSNDVEPVETFNAEQNSLLNTVSARANLENNGEEIQEFSFEVKSFRTVIGQPTTFKFTSKLPSNEVLIRIPENGKIIENQFSNGESIHHSHGEYWSLSTNDEQKSFEVSVLFEIPGNYFLTLDNDADHVYVEVQDSPSVMRTEKLNELEEAEIINQSEEMTEQNNTKDSINNSTTIQPVIAVEENLSIPEELIVIEEERILEETRDIQNRSISSVNNWSQFRSAWNSSTVTIIILGNISFSSSILGDSLNTRLSSITLNGGTLNFQNSGYSLVMSGVAGLTITSTGLTDEPALIGRDSRTAPLIIHNGSGLIEINHANITMSTGTAGSIISGQNINLNGAIQIRADTAGGASATVRATGIELVRNGTLKIIPISNQYGWILSSTNSGLRPVLSTAGSTIIIQANRFSMVESRNGVFLGLNSWNSIDVMLSGLNGATVVNSNSNPNDFNERYLTTFNDRRYTGMVFNASGSGWVTPPVSYNLSLQANPDVGGNPSATNTTLTQGSTTTLNANPNSGYRFVRWEVVSGTGANIANATSATTTFTMGSANTTVRAVYEEITYNLTLEASPSDGGNPSAEASTLAQGSTTTLNANPNSGYHFVRWEVVSGTGTNIVNTTSATTTFMMGSTDTTVQAVYETITQVSPVDPLDPEVEVDPENKPDLPEGQGLLSIDFVSQFNFGLQAISARDQTYYAQPQRLMNEDGVVSEKEERPNFVQISDRRPESERNGWELAVTQKEQFKGKENQVLNGASITLSNQQVVTAQGKTAPELQSVHSLIPGNRQTLIKAQGSEGMGTWIYRFGDAETAKESVALNVPKGANPEATSYSTKLTWELSAVPYN
ncbi:MULTISPECIES: WxL domain-containing protein [unclassified Enterococcus]|uniref:WxL domain-containing protein n=1 Tax=unclassified Enterococcus TaxID=2608891 RepID=UPI003F225774